MDGFERVHHVEAMHVHDGGIDTQLVTAKHNGGAKHILKSHTLNWLGEQQIENNRGLNTHFNFLKQNGGRYL